MEKMGLRNKMLVVLAIIAMGMIIGMATESCQTRCEPRSYVNPYCCVPPNGDMCCDIGAEDYRRLEYGSCSHIKECYSNKCFRCLGSNCSHKYCGHVCVNGVCHTDCLCLDRLY